MMIGDVIVVVLGCDSPIVLRPTAGAQYVVVGECYVDELQDATALLGPLPAYRRVQIHKDSFRRLNTDYQHTETGQIHQIDPRLSDMPRAGEFNAAVKTLQDDKPLHKNINLESAASNNRHICNLGRFSLV